MSNFSQVWNGAKYSIMLALSFDNHKSGIYSVSKTDLETVVEQNPAYFATTSMSILCSRLDKMGADACSDVTSMFKKVLKDREPVCRFDTILL